MNQYGGMKPRFFRNGPLASWLTTPPINTTNWITAKMKKKHDKIEILELKINVLQSIWIITVGERIAKKIKSLVINFSGSRESPISNSFVYVLQI